MRLSPILLALAVCALAPLAACAQVRVPFFSGASTAFEPEISVVNSGEVLDAQAVVSNDRKYVTLNMRASSSRLLALRQFDFATSGTNNRLLGFVGGAGAAAAAPSAPGTNASGANDTRQNPLDRPGTNLVAGLDD
jgi:hypothetical protein